MPLYWQWIVVFRQNDVNSAGRGGIKKTDETVLSRQLTIRICAYSFVRRRR
jgi:hypothetical protein